MIKRFFLVVIMLAMTVCRVSFADAEFWATGTFQFPIKENLKMNVIPEIRVRNNLGELYYWQTYVGPVLILNKNYEAAAYYALKYSKSGGNWTSGNLGYLDLVYKNDYFSNRGRIEYDNLLDTFKLRDSFQLKKNGWFIGDELFFNFKKGFLDEERIAVGYSSKMNGKTELSLGYLLRRTKSIAGGDWMQSGGINSGLKIVF